MNLQEYLANKFMNWTPLAPEVTARSKSDISMQWIQLEPFQWLLPDLLFRLEMKTKIPPWTAVYNGAKVTKTIDNLAPSHPHKFRLKVILKSSAVSRLAEQALAFYGDENTVYEATKTDSESNEKFDEINSDPKDDSSNKNKNDNVGNSVKLTASNTVQLCEKKNENWLESQYSCETWTSTDTEGSTAACFCMAVHCGYLKQLQTMLEERPALIGVVNSVNGFTPLATAVRKGDINTVKFLLAAGAEINQTSTSGQTALHLAVLNGFTNAVELLLDKGAYFQVLDLCKCRVEHYAVDSGKLDMLKLVLDRGGDINVRDSNGWTPLFRAVNQGAKTEIITELVLRGSDLTIVDRKGLPLVNAAKLLKNRQGRTRDSILRLVDAQFPHDKALANFTRLTKKISSVHTLLK